MKITDVRLVPLRTVERIGALEPAWEPGASMVFARGGGHVLEIATDEGLTGLGPPAKGRVVEVARPLLLGRDPRAVEELFEEVRFFLREQRGAASVDVALWDLAAKAKGLPLHRLCGGSRDRVPAYASFVGLGDPSERADLAQRVVAEGFRAVKLRLHFATVREDVELVQRVRAAVGDRIAILCDANQAQGPGAWQPGVRWDFARALDTARELQQLGVGWLEEPLSRYAWVDLHRLADAVAIPIAGGENLRLPEYEPMLAARPYDLVQPDAMVVDGLTGLRRAFASARRHGVGIVPHHGGRGLGTIAHLHAVAAAPDVPFVEILHDPPVGHFAHGFAPFVGAPTLDADGCMRLPTGPGLGVALDPGFRDDTAR